MGSEGVNVRLVIPGSDSPTPIATPGVPTSAVPPPVSRTDLPRTGVELFALLLIAVVLVTLGALLVKAGRATRRLSA